MFKEGNILESVVIKSTGGAIEVWIEPSGSYMNIRGAVLEKLGKNKQFFSGTNREVIFFGKQFSSAQKRELRNMLLMDFDIKNVRFPDEDDVAEAKIEQSPKEETPELVQNGNDVTLVSDKIYDADSIFISTTMRSGQRAECTGDIVVVGDVNPGAELVAGGSIAVFGKLRGLAHAGAQGRTDVCIAANALLSKQIRISSKVAIIPEGRKIEGPEVAKLKDDKIVIRVIG